MKAAEVIDDLKRRFPNEPEYIQAVDEVLSTPSLSVTTSSSVSAYPTVSSRSAYRGWTTKAKSTTTWAIVCSTTTPSAPTKAASVSTRQSIFLS